MRTFVYILAAVAVVAAPVWGRHGGRPARVRNAYAVTGTYVAHRLGTLDLQALPGRRIRFHLVALALLSSRGGPHVGEAGGILPVRHGVAVYKPDEGTARLIFHFAGRRVRVTQTGDASDMGFGEAVDATGTYVKTSDRAPKFDPTDQY